jgi:amino acid adenylation domain-containing protein
MAPCQNAVVPRGAVGELCFGGSQVFRGYLKRPGLNAQKIFNHPLYGRIYRSGDMGIMLPDNSILSIGRLDDQVKIRGQRVELGEISSLVLDHPAVRDCATLLHQRRNGAQALITFWVPFAIPITAFEVLPPTEYRSCTLDLFEKLSLKLSSYMVPTHLVPISQIPMTPQAKVDSRRLRNTFDSLSTACLTFTTLDNDKKTKARVLSSSERRIAEVLAKSLDIKYEEVGHASSFFSLGLDSMSATHFAKGLREAGFDHFPISVILNNHTVERLSSVIANKLEPGSRGKDHGTTLANVFEPSHMMHVISTFKDRGITVQKVLPCTPLQEAMLSSSSSTPSYYNTMVFKLSGRVDRLKGSWALMFERHEIFRTAFVSIDHPQYAFAQVVIAPEPMQCDQLGANEDVSAYAKEALSCQLREYRPPIRLAIQRTRYSSRLIFCCHHALYDRSAISVLLSEIQDHYLGMELLPPISYESYLQYMVTQDLQAADDFWAGVLDSFQPTFFPNLGLNIQKHEPQSFCITRILQTPLSNTLGHCQRNSFSLLAMVQAAWARLLHFCTGEHDLCFGNVVNGRTLPEEGIDRLVAPCFNTVPVRCNFNPRISNIDICKRLHSYNIESHPFHLTPLRRIQSKLKETGRLFDTLVILQQSSTPLDDSIWSLEAETGDMDLPLVCEVVQDREDDRLRLTLHYNDTLLQQRDATLLAEVFDIMLQTTVQYPNSPMNDTVGFPVQVLGQSNMNFRILQPTQGELLHSSFELNSVQRPEAVALDFLDIGGERQTFTFERLNTMANQIAHALVEHGTGVEDIIPVHIAKGPQFYASILGVLKSGAAFAPIHPDLPDTRKRFMLSELRPKAMLCLTGSVDWSRHVPVINVAEVRNHATKNPKIQGLRPTSLAYCLYTSGSTGIPKAVSVDHSAPIQTIESSRDLIPWKHDSRLLQYAAITFDMCYYDCFLAWSLGFTLCAAEQHAMLNNLTYIINTLDVDLLDLTPSVAASLRQSEMPVVKWLYCIGEAMASNVVMEWGDACVNSYGPTEAAFCTTIFPVEQSTKTSVIGKPFPTTAFAVFPFQGERPVPLLGVGELYIGGAQLARGYYGRPDLTDEKFVQKCGQRFYKSGDMVRMLSDGNFEFLGRVDDQVKIRGLRVELGEINHVIQDCDDRIVAVTTQVLRTSSESKDQLVSFLVHAGTINEGERTELSLIAKRAVKERLPVYMVPQFFLFLDEIPRSMAGKVDRKVLADIFVKSEGSKFTTNQLAEDISGYRWTENENRIRDVLAKLSGTSLDKISPWATIYELGLDSISAVQIAATLRKQGLQVNAADVMKHMNCKDLAMWLDSVPASQLRGTKPFDFGAFEQQYRADVERACHINEADVEAIRPCTFLQCGILSQFIAQDGDCYFNYIRLQLNAGVDLGRIRGAWSATVRKHRMLRTGFTHIRNNNTPFAMIHYDYQSTSLPWYDATRHADPVESWIAKSRYQAVKELHRPPWCVRVIQERGMIYMDLALLHALFDAQSLRLIFDDIIHAYNDEMNGTVIPLEPLLSNILSLGSVGNAERDDYWKKVGKSIAPTRFPNLSPLRSDPAPPIVLTKTASKTTAELDAGCKRANISLHIAGMVSWAALLSAYTGELSVSFGVVLSGRNVDGAESVVFPCITTIPFVCNISDRRDQVLKAAIAQSADIQRHQFTPLNEIQKLMGCPNEPFFDTIFAYQKTSSSNSEHDLWTIVDEKATSEYPISIELEPIKGRVEYRLTFLPHQVPKEQAALILEQFDHLLNSYIFTSLELSPKPLYDQLLYSVTPAKQPQIPCEAGLLHEMVEHTAARHPERIALEFATELHNNTFTSRKWTYNELNCEGNRIAHLLLSRGSRPGQLVGVCFEKCPEASFAMLGILKAGCAFVALDPAAPAARKAFIVRDAGVEIVLSKKYQFADTEERMDAEIINLDEVDWRNMSQEKPSLEGGIVPQDRSYCLYTSGTTGTPKGCELTHENAVQALLSFQRLFAGHWDRSSRWLQFASFHFDVSVLEQYWSWSVGICVVSAPRDLIFEDIATSIKTLDITHIDLTPSLARILHPDDVPSLCKGVFITGGENLTQEILDVWGPKGVIYNGYGPTEATIGVTMYPRVPANGKPSNIGPQFDNVGSYVLRPGSDVPVLRGGVGELCVSGKLVGKGYLNRPDLTDDRFPHLGCFDERVYRTGDLVRILHNGNFDFLGRADDQVKLRGQRLEVGEINSVIKQSGIAVADVATVVLKHPKQQKEQLVSFVVTGTKAKGEAKFVLEETDQLARARQTCQEKLPPYMVPTHFITLTNLPLTTNNKADVKTLRKMYEGLSVNDLKLLLSIPQVKDEEWSRQERNIRNVLKDVLEIDNDFSKDVSFFELGMDSITVIGVSRSLKQAGILHAAVSVVLSNATVRRLAKSLSRISSASSDHGPIMAAQQAITATQHRHRRVVAETLRTDARNVEALAPCTPLQQGIIARSLESEQGLYFNTFQFRLTDEVNLPKLQDAWQRIFASTQILRTTFVNTEDGFVQAAVRRTKLRFDDVTLLQNEEVEHYLGLWKKDWVLRNQPHMKSPFELVLLRMPGHNMLIVHIFHALYDGNSIGLLFKSVWNAYNGSAICPAPSYQSALAHGPLQSIQGAREFWEKNIADTAFRPLPLFTNQPDQRPINFSHTITGLRDFETVRRKLNVTAQAIAQACWRQVLCQHFKSTLTVGVVVSGRNIDFESADQVIGPLFNTIPFQYRSQKEETWASIIKRTHAFNVAAHPYQHTPLRDIMKWCKRGPNQPLFDTLFVYQVAAEHEDWVKNDIWELIDGESEVDFPLAIEVEQKASEVLKLTLAAQRNVLNEKVADNLLKQYEAVLRAALQDSDLLVETFSSDDHKILQEKKEGISNQPPKSFDGPQAFEWTINAKILREEVASLASISLEEINETTSIFELGLDSIDAIKLTSRLKKRGINLPVSNIMRGLTIANMLLHTSNAKEKFSDRPSDMIFQSHKRRLESYLRRRGLATDVEKILPLTPLQEAMVAEMIASRYTRYYNHDVLELKPGIDIERLQGAWTEVVMKTPILRTSFLQIEDSSIDFAFAQVIHDRPHAFWRSSEVNGKPEFAAVLDSTRQKALNSSELEPLFHIQLIRSTEQTYLVLSIAHALYDGWSLGLLHADVQQAYTRTFEARPSYESALHEILTTSGSDAVAFWRDYLTDAKFSSFPRRSLFQIDTSHVAHRKERASRISFPEVASFAKKNSIALQTLGQTVYGLTLASYTNSLDVVFGSVLSGRDDDEKAKLLFPTMNTVAIRTIVHGTRQDMLHYVQDNFSSIKQWQHFPLRKALNLAGVQGRLFESLFIYQKNVGDVRGKQRQIYGSIEGHSDVEYPVCVEMEVVREELFWRCAVKEEVFDNLGAQELLNRLDDIMIGIMEHPDAPTIDFTAGGISICGLPASGDEHAQASDSGSGRHEPRVHEQANSATANTIREVLASVSKTLEQDITEDMTIFHIGLDSISAIKVSSLLRKRGVVLGVGEMLKAGTVNNMAQIADARTSSPEDDIDDAETVLKATLARIDRAKVLRYAGINETSVEMILPATAGQVYMLSMWTNSDGASFYPDFMYEIQGLVDLEVIKKAWHDLVAAHTILRTRFVTTQDEHVPYVQVIANDSEATVLDITGWAEDRISKIEKRTLKQPYAQLFAAQSSNGWTLRLDIHHALYDGVSLPLLIQDLQALYNGAQLPTPSNALTKFVAATSSTHARKDRKSFWENYLKDVTQHTLPQPTTTPSSKIEIFTPGLLSDITALETLTRKGGLTTHSLLLAIYAKLYAALTSTPQDTDVIIGIYLANRSLPLHSIARAPVPTVNLVPLRVSTPLTTDVLGVAAQIQSDIQEISSLARASVGLWEIKRWTGVVIDSFINFLKLPGNEDQPTVYDGGIKIIQTRQWSEKVCCVTELQTGGFEVPEELRDGGSNEAFLVSFIVWNRLGEEWVTNCVSSIRLMLRLRFGMERWM